ncbi:MAG: ArnT family glycosyltransferase [Phycisphaerae bacterium]
MDASNSSVGHGNGPEEYVSASRSRQRYTRWLLTVIFLAAMVRIISPTGWIGSDDVSYFAAAEHVISQVPMERVHHQYARSPIVLLTAASVLVGGSNLAALMAPAFFMSLLSIVVVIELGSLLWTRAIGLTAGTILAFIPVFVNHSTAVLPGTYTCAFAGLAMLLVLVGSRRDSLRSLVMFMLMAGFFAGAAVSTKLFAGGVVVGMASLVWLELGFGRKWWLAAGASALGLLAFLGFETAFYGLMSGDPYFKWNAMSTARDAHSQGNFHSATYTSMWTTLQLVWQRFSMPLHAEFSGLGWFGWLALPAVAWSMMVDRRAKPFALWFAVTFLGVGFIPISMQNGIHVFPPGFFDGVNLMVLCVPMSLCCAWLMFRVMSIVRSHAWLGQRTFVRRWPVFVMAVLVISCWNRWHYNSRSRLPQQELAVAMIRLTEETAFRDEEPIYLLPSLYWRYRLMFPESLRDRLRVVADRNAPNWWKTACPDMTDRHVELPITPTGYLIATPSQLYAEGHYWDYGVGFPGEVAAWRSIEPTVRIARRTGKLLVLPASQSDDRTKCLLCVIDSKDTRETVAQR